MFLEKSKSKYFYRFYFLGVVFLFIFISNLYPQNDRLWVNPGMKLAYQFGKDKGFIFGFELSTVWENGDRAGGILVDLDFCKKSDFIKLNIAFESHPFPLQYAPTGVSIGPCLVFHNSKIYYGFSTIAYVPFLGLVPFAGASFMLDHPPAFETGSYIKIPILVKGEIHGFGG